ncbi:uncharacterized protein LOC131954538 [Physella acuta]|uniref:uncharacterized protein LOC131954538 n=1 Tax=Physella acuta TaxID=109671 RepID=UPI0027DB3DA5|nr:uncharacterized protein LOC131954538 [Physella acuta]
MMTNQDATHPTTTCDECQTKGFRGVRWKCTQCFNYDLCDECYNDNKHFLDHVFWKIVSPGSERVVSSPRSTHKVTTDQSGPEQEIYATHPTTTCDECQTKGFRGVRWKCTQCFNYDLCDECYKDNKHFLDHVFWKIVKPRVEGVITAPRSRQPVNSERSQATRQALQIVTHPNITCDGCNTEGIVGVRWNCAQCVNYDLCEVCYNSNKHSLDHKFRKIVQPGVQGVIVSPRSAQPISSDHIGADQSNYSNIIHPNITCDECKVLNIRGVRWKCLQCADFDLCGTCFRNKKHFPEHQFRRITQPLAARRVTVNSSTYLVNTNQNREGQQVDIDTHPTTTCDECQTKGFSGVRWKCSQCIDYDLCDECFKYGKHSPDHAFFKIVKSGAERIVEPPRSENQLMSDQSLPNCVKHPFITCDECNTEGITGVRWKCTQCPDYDLCDGCYHGNKHNLDHKFWKIPKPGSERILIVARSLDVKQDHKSDLELEDIIRRVVELDIPEELVRQVVAAKQTIPAFTSVEELTSTVLASLETTHTGPPEVASEAGSGAAPALTDAGSDDRLQCKVCLDAECEMTFVPCGHLVCCSECAEGMKACPICRADIQCQIRTYLS